MAGRAGTGIDIHIDRVPMRESGMTPYEVMLSESQERMLIVTEPAKEKEVMEIFHKWDLDAVVIGEVTGSKKIRVINMDELVAEIPIESLTDEAPLYDRSLAPPPYLDILHDLDMDNLPVPEDLNKALLTILSSPTIASKECVYRQYDHMVRTDTVVGPGSDSAVIRIKGTNKGIAITTDCNSRYCFSDPYAGGAIAVAEAARNIVCAGGEPVGLTDCLNFGNPEKPEIMWQFQQAIEGISVVCRKFNIPVISGNVSFYNETNDISIYPTPVIGMAGIIEDISKCMTHYFKKEGDIIILLGNNIEELGMSEYLREIHYKVRGVPPFLDLDLEKNVQELCLYGIKQGIIKSAHDTSEGGLAVALSECCIRPDDKRNMGAEIGLSDEIRADAILFGETQSRIIITVSPERVKELEGVAVNRGVPFTVIGKVVGDKLVIRHKTTVLIDMPVDVIADAWENAMQGYLGEE